MPTKAAEEFRQRSEEYQTNEDGRNFNAWYHGDDIKRIIWAKFLALDKELTKDTIHPYIFFDGLDQLTLEDMLSPLVEILTGSKQKYYPFIFKPELASVHYIAGFLRKNEDNTISIILFNPTGTFPRLQYGDYGYEFCLLKEPKAEDIEQNTIYFKIHEGKLEYTLLNPDVEEITNSFTDQELIKLGIVLDLSKPLSMKDLNDQIKPKRAQILEITSARNETERKIEIISSPHKIQTAEKDGGKLVSCGPLSVEFLEYAMSQPEYMAKLDNEFSLPESLSSLINDDASSYKQKIIKLRQQHDEVLDTINDDLLEAIEEVYSKVTGIFFNKRDDKQTEYDDQYVDYDYYQNHDDYGYSLNRDEEDLEVNYKDTENNTDYSKEDNLQDPQIKQKTPELSTASTNTNNSPDLQPQTIEIMTRHDVQFIYGEIQRFENNSKSIFSINNSMKAKEINAALLLALANGVKDVRTDQGVKDALAIHRIFGFFGCKLTTATINNDESLAKSYEKTCT